MRGPLTVSHSRDHRLSIRAPGNFDELRFHVLLQRLAGERGPRGQLSMGVLRHVSDRNRRHDARILQRWQQIAIREACQTRDKLASRRRSSR